MWNSWQKNIDEMCVSMTTGVIKVNQVAMDFNAMTVASSVSVCAQSPN